VDEPTITVGRIAKAHGVRGEVTVENRSDNPDRWVPGSVLFDADGRQLTVRTVRPHGGRLLVTFEKITDRSHAETLAGSILVVPESWLPALAEGELWSFQIEGCTVRTKSGRSLGTVHEVLAYPAHDVWRVVDDDGTETLIPAVDDVFIVSVDADARTAVVRDVPGLTVEDER
jgi:16S rRNA processing protein RimM